MKKPSQRMNIRSSDLLTTRMKWRDIMETHDLPYVQKILVDAAMTTQIAQIERLDALIELMEHFVVDHLCAEGHGPKAETKKGENLDDFLKGINSQDNEGPTKD